MQIERKLPEGVEFEGKFYRDYKLREQLVRDGVEIMESPDGVRAQVSDTFFGVCAIAKRVSFVGIPAEQVNAELIMNMSQTDFNALNAAEKELAQLRLAFRDAAGAAAQDHPGSAEVGV